MIVNSITFLLNGTWKMSDHILPKSNDVEEKNEPITNIFLLLWIILYEELHQKLLKEHMDAIQIHLQFCKIDKKFSLENFSKIQEQDISVRLNQFHKLLVEQWNFSIPPQINQLYSSSGLLYTEISSLYSDFKDGKELVYGFKGEIMLESDVKPFSLGNYIENKIIKLELDIFIEMCIDICSKIKIDETVSYDFLFDRTSPENVEIEKEAMKIYGSMTYQEIFTLLNEKSGGILENYLK